MKKNLSLIINGVLVIAVAVLYVLHFLGTGKSSDDADITTKDTTAIQVDASIAYLNIDTVLQEYDMYYEFMNKLQTKTQQLEAELNSKSRAWEREAADFQDKAQKGLLLRSQMQDIQQKLAAEQQNLLQLRDQMTMELAEEEQILNRQLLYSIMEYLEDYNEDKGFKYILGTSFGGNILYANDNLDITQEVLKGLNERYAQKKLEEEAAEE